MEERYYDRREVEKMLEITDSKFQKDIKKKRIHASKPFGKKYTMADINEYKRWLQFKQNPVARLDINYNERFMFLPTMPRTHKMIDPYRYRSPDILVIGENGTVFDCNHLCIRNCWVHPENGYVYIHLNNGIQIRLHKLVDMVWNDNKWSKMIRHHINGDKTDNRAINILPVSENEHAKAHRMMNAINKAKSEEERTAAQKAYNEFIEEIREDNREEHHEDLIIISDTEDPRRSILFVTYASFLEFQKTNNECDLVIRGQWCE